MVAGCGYGYASGISMGRGAPPKPSGCPVRHEAVLPHEAQQRFEQVGVLCYIYPGAPQAMPDDFLDEIRPEACRLGGEVVVRHGLCTGGPARPRSGVEFGVYVIRRATPGGPAASARGQDAPPEAPPPP
jgi:hypothetical protein